MTTKTYRWLSLISGIILIAFSFMLLTYKGEGVLTLSVFIAIGFIMHGIGDMSIYFSTDKGARHGWLMVGGIVSLIFGMWTLTIPGTIGMAIALPLVIATWIIFYGVLRIVSWVHLKEWSSAAGNMNLIMGLIGIILGFVLLRKPEVTDFLISIVLFIVFIVEGVASIGNFFLYKGVNNK